MFGKASSKISNITVENAYVRGTEYVGGIVGYSDSYSDITVKNCHYIGLVAGDKDAICGGIVGEVFHGGIFENSFEGIVIGGICVGGIIGTVDYADVENCRTEGAISGLSDVGGVIGRARYLNSISCCYAMCNVIADSGVAGGFIGNCTADSPIQNCYTTGNVRGKTYVGGFIGDMSNSASRRGYISNCYSLNIVTSDENTGGFIGCDRRIWGENIEIFGCYYIKDIGANEDLFGTSIAETDITGEIEGKRNAFLRKEQTFVDWDFENTWAINNDVNGGYPYLQWQEGMLSEIAASSVQISETALTLSVGDYAYLTATVSPVNASNKSVIWSSSDPDIAAVSVAGKVTAVSAGTATITATADDGGYTAACTVTVTERLAEEYRINSITVRDDNGAVQSEIPFGSCLATVSVTNVASEGNTLVFLAAYTAAGQYQGLMWVSVEDLPVGATIKITLPVDNSDGKIANLKAFAVASLFNPSPLGETVSFLT